MLFNSYNFLALFLPLALVFYWLVARLPLEWGRKAALVLISLVFYGLGASRFLPVLGLSILINFAASKVIQHRVDRDRPTMLAVSVGVVLNLLLLFYYKYAEATLSFLHVDLGLTGFEVPNILLPLAISFYTFQQIGYLVDVSRKRTRSGGLLSHLGFVLFFPAMISGPIVKHSETVPQMSGRLLRIEAGYNIAIGLMIFAIGMFKKTVIADSISLYTSPVVEAVGAGGHPGFVDAWMVAFLYVLQIYFDFSGYSDMAIGVARMFGIILPLNFHSPLKSDGFVEIWRRWHMSLGRWVQTYIFQPLSVPMARFAMNRDLDGVAFNTFSTYLPTITAMVVLGVWHGPGLNYALFGLMNGVFMTVNELWAHYQKQRRKRLGIKKVPTTLSRIALARGLTVLAFVLSHVPFQSLTFEATLHMFGAMAGFSVTSPEIEAVLTAWPFGLAGAAIMLLLGYLAIFLLPNTQQIMGRFNPCLEWDKWSKVGHAKLHWEWKMRLPYAVLTGLIFFVGFAFIARGSLNFIYFGF
ncbi:MBOAT family O-acyltransferase [Novosphingobium jiangmenense]|uniref:Probable alginate O-acetylase AlgI n=1 Tax=Novosphingobium jiangmenense TaxID=2791981 RepID=A0ABS0HLA5_9SPHN|nr:MBOAT family protein [Novosphingobium jiangmenense]MBF9153040.1 MBOAT family protein [Novosphingobium jiangmenense]